MPRTFKHREAITNRVPFTVDTDGPNNNQPPHQDPSSLTTEEYLEAFPSLSEPIQRLKRNIPLIDTPTSIYYADQKTQRQHSIKISTLNVNGLTTKKYPLIQKMITDIDICAMQY